MEVPLSVITFAGRRVPIAGGGFWRATPRVAISFAARRVAEEGRPLVLYLHPHEFDPERLRSHNGIARDFYVNFGRTSIAGKLRHMLERFPFVPISVILTELAKIPDRRIDPDDRSSAARPEGQLAT